MKKITRLDILYITIAIVMILISFLLNGFYKSYRIQHIFEIGFLNVTDIYSLALIPISIFLFVMGKYRIVLTLSYIMILSLFRFFVFTPMEFQYNTLFTVCFLIIYAILVVGIYALSSQKYIWINKFVKNKYFRIGYYLMFVIAFLMSTFEEGRISQLIFGLLLFLGLLLILYNQQRWFLNFMISSVLSLILATFYIGCCYHWSGDVGFIDFSIGNILKNCLKNYLWLISSFIMLHIAVKKLNTPLC